jgi:hypothetical protein
MFKFLHVHFWDFRLGGMVDNILELEENWLRGDGDEAWKGTGMQEVEFGEQVRVDVID